MPCGPGERFDPGDVVDVDVEVAADRRHRLLVEVDADRGQRARVVALAARGDAADVDHRLARVAAGVGRRLERHRGQLLDVAFEVGEVEVVEPLLAERGDADRHVLEILAALLRGDDDLAVAAVVGRGLGLLLRLALGG